jgi:hypothetical protein
MMYLNNYMLPSHGTRAIAASIDKDMDNMKFEAFAWLDCNRQLLVETTCCFGEGKQTERKHLRQFHKASLELLDKVLIEVVQPKAVKTYCLVGAGKIDWYGRIHVADLSINKNLKATNCAKEVKEGQFLNFQDHPHQRILPFPFPTKQIPMKTRHLATNSLAGWPMSISRTRLMWV